MFFSCFFSFSYNVWALMKKYSGRQLAQFKYTSANNFCQWLMEKRQDDCMNAHPYAELLVVVFSSIKNDFKEHSGAQTDSKPLFLH